MTIYDLSDKMQKEANWLTDEQANRLEGEKTKKGMQIVHSSNSSIVNLNLYHFTSSLFIGMVMHLAPPPPRGSSLPAKVTTNFS